jgi:hypothetical protein
MVKFAIIKVILIIVYFNVSIKSLTIYAQNNTAKVMRKDSLKKCIESKQKLLNGIWRIKSIEIPGVVYNQEQRNNMEQSFLNHTLTYINGKVTIKTPVANDSSFVETKVIWTLQDDCETIKIFNPEDKSVTTSHFSVSESKLVIDRGDLGVVTFVPLKLK